jgi:hypothetical protein
MAVAPACDGRRLKAPAKTKSATSRCFPSATIAARCICIFARTTPLWGANAYHSAILRSPENQRWVTAMDIAVGQARCLDEPAMREVLVAIADWKMDKKQFEQVGLLPGWSRLSAEAQALVRASYLYYDKGIFPPSDLVSLTPPSLLAGAAKKGVAL